MIILAAMLAASSDILQVRDAYANCVKTQAVRLGAGNTESADTILRAVSSICQPQWIALEMAFPGETGVAIAEEGRARALRNWRSQAEDAAIAALLEARVKQPH